MEISSLTNRLPRPRMRGLQLLLLLLVGTVAQAQNATVSDCIISKYNTYADAQEQWQTGLTELIAGVMPHYTDVARLYMTDQLNGIERRRLAVEYLVNNQPDKLRMTMPPNNWLNLGVRDEERIDDFNRRYGELLRLAKEAKKRAPHPDGDGLRTAIKDRIMKLPKYQELFDAFLQSTQAIKGIQCQ